MSVGSSEPERRQAQRCGETGTKLVSSDERWCGGSTGLRRKQVAYSDTFHGGVHDLAISSDG
ncbi:hypothetical protein ACERK3_15860 [Phycisphaerales bacterium AB-hyl4]|uniref:Uncharacterized protein n=1 Tax=Natronomicrosphaera hydrolytica TaxID=3242702 RepID=A0ABV4U9S8_9BACT